MYIKVCMKVHKFAKCVFMSIQSLEICIVYGELHIKPCSRDHPKSCIQCLCLQVAFMFVGHIALKFAQNFTLKIGVGRLYCCLQVTLIIAILTQNKLHKAPFHPSIQPTWLSYLVLQTSYITAKQFKAHKSLEAYN